MKYKISLIVVAVAFLLLLVGYLMSMKGFGAEVFTMMFFNQTRSPNLHNKTAAINRIEEGGLVVSSPR